MSAHAYAETSSAAMCAGFPTPQEPTLGASNLFVLSNLLQYICKCAHTHKSTISKKMILIYMAVGPSLYTHYSAGEAYPQDRYPFPDNVDEVLDLPPAPMTTNVLLQNFCMRFYSKCAMPLST